MLRFTRFNDLGKERRSEPRLGTDSAVRVQVQRGSTVEFPGTVVNVSARGLCVVLSEALVVGDVVRVIADNHHTIGLVRHCHPVSGQYSAGVERTDEWVYHAAEEPLEELAAAGTPQAGISQPLKTHFGDIRTAAIRELFDEAAPARKKAASKKTLVLGAALGTALLAAVLGVAFWGPGSSLQKPAAAAPGATAPVTAAAIPAAAPPGTGTVAQPTNVAIHASGQSLVLACADGKKVFEKLFAAGDAAKFSFSVNAALRTGDAAALDVAVDGQPLGAMGAEGKTRAWAFTPREHHEIAPVSVQNCSEF